MFVNPERDDGRVSRRLVDLLRGRGITPVALPNAPVPGIELPVPSASVEVAFVLGGDGTILSCLRQLPNLDIPMVGVNMGRVGFLTQVEPGNLEGFLDAWLEGKAYIDERMLLSVCIGDKHWMALNDVAVTRGECGRVVELCVESDGGPLGRFHADGVLVSTPTGSTAYAMAAGGPIISPRVQALAVVPICAHALYARPVVAARDEKLTVCCCNSDAATVFVDGEPAGRLARGQKVAVEMAPQSARFLCVDAPDFYPRLRQKLGDYGKLSAE